MLRLLAATAIAAVFVPQLAHAQTSSSRPAVGVAVKASTLGVGIDAAARVHPKVNLRGGFNFLSLSHDFEDKDSGIIYVGELTLRSIAAYVDWFPFGSGFHISPVFLLNNTNKVTLSSSVAGGKTITIDNTTYMSSSTNPIRISGEASFGGARPGVTIGFGNIAGGRRVKVPVELGVIFASTPVARLSFTGTACQSNGLNCRDMATDATIQGHVRADEADLNDSIKPLRFFPVLSFGLSFRF